MDTDKVKVARALRVIATHRPSYILDMAAYQMDGTGEGGEPALDVGEAYNRLQITTRSAPDSTIFEYYKSLSGGAAPGSKESFTQALRAIAHDRQSHFLLRKLNDPNAVVTPEETDLSQPVGLNNIGNTCYLNSLLQYFYTIRAVRDVAMNIDEYQMPLTGDELANRRAGGRKVTRSEVEKGQLCKLILSTDEHETDNICSCERTKRPVPKFTNRSNPVYQANCGARRVVVLQ